ncbi:hypothetical protein IE077_000297 [Cardiosporidium cionae]|uniref:Uncharacterized protein n=1 Tax=Cardiosporidium cionae TaxID=476202 RepID=A0ABQ7JBH1_9APIC|nr:hypothetical protein IE077_000297 [Cardiosporidium cionae]|eukprot:KAF8821361.1 hypothetical protein IE077_000297 [Cardiosporidium cionae]
MCPPIENVMRLPSRNERKHAFPPNTSLVSKNSADNNGGTSVPPPIQARTTQKSHTSPVRISCQSMESKLLDGREKAPTQDSSFHRSNTTPSTASPPSASNLKVILPRMAKVIEKLLEDSDIQRYDERVVHLLVDILQRETLKILGSASDLADLRLMENQETYSSERSIIVTAEDDAQKLTTFTNSLMFDDSTPFSKEVQPLEFGFHSVHLGNFPSVLPPHLPEDVNINTMIPHWDLKLSTKGLENSEEEEATLSVRLNGV